MFSQSLLFSTKKQLRRKTRVKVGQLFFSNIIIYYVSQKILAIERCSKIKIICLKKALIIFEIIFTYGRTINYSNNLNRTILFYGAIFSYGVCVISAGHILLNTYLSFWNFVTKLCFSKLLFFFIRPQENK